MLTNKFAEKYPAVAEIRFAANQYADFEKDLERAKIQLTMACNNMSIEEFDELPYEDAKQIYPLLKQYISVPSFRKELESVYETKRREQHPELNGPVYYPELKEYMGLPNHILKDVDTVLGTLWCTKGKNKPEHTIIDERPFCKYVKISPNIYHDIMEFLCRKGIVKKEYEYTCGCGRCKTYIPEAEYEDAKAYFSLPEDTIKENGFEEFEDHCLYIPCNYSEEDAGYDVDSLDALGKHSGIRYIKVKAPNKEHENW